jgi:hypothetical protein
MIFGSDPPYDSSADHHYHEENAPRAREKQPECLKCPRLDPISDDCRESCLQGSPFSIDFIKSSFDMLEGLMNPNPDERMKFVKDELKDHPWWSTTDIGSSKDWWNEMQNKKIKPKVNIFGPSSVNEYCKKLEKKEPRKELIKFRQEAHSKKENK